MPATHSKLLSSQVQKEIGSSKYKFDLSNLPKKGWAVRGVAIENVYGEDRPTLVFEKATEDLTTPSTEDFAVALRLAIENTRPKFEFIPIQRRHPFEGRHYNNYSPSWLKQTAWGDVMFEADVDMKRLSHCMRREGDSYLSSESIYPGLKGSEKFPCTYSGPSPIYLTCKSVKVCTSSRSCFFMGEPDMQITLDRSPDYSKYMSSLYPVFAHKDALSFLRVQELPKLICAAEWLLDQGIEIDEDWIKEKTQPLAASNCGDVVAPKQEFNAQEINLAELYQVIAQQISDESVTIEISDSMISTDRLSFDVVETYHDPSSGEVIHHKRSHIKISSNDYDWLYVGLPVNAPIGGTVPAESTWADLYRATSLPLWSMTYDEKGQKVHGMHWGGCSMTSFNTEPVRCKQKTTSTARQSTPIAGGSHTSYRNGMVGVAGTTTTKSKSLGDDELTDLKRATSTSRKGQQKTPQWYAGESGSSRGGQRFVGAIDQSMFTGDIHNEQGQRVVDTLELRFRRDVSEQQGGKKVTILGKLGLHKPTQQKKKTMLPPDLVVKLKTTFQCTLCKKTPMMSPVLAASCCGSILGCEECVNNHYAQQSTHCPGCHCSQGYEKMFRLHGIDEILQALNNGVADVDSAVFAESLKCTVCHIAPLNSQPAVATCCGRIVGCSDCIKRWHETKDKCPVCSKDGKANTVRIPGMASILQQLDDFFHTSEMLSP